MPEAVATLAPSGAGRFQDWIWPGRLTACGQGVTMDTSCTSRNGSASQAGITLGFGGGINVPVAVNAGVACVRMPCGPGAVGVAFRVPMLMLLRTTKQFISAAYDDQAVYRYVWMFAGDGVAANAGQDFGLEFIQTGAAGGARILADVGFGFGFRVADANVLQFIARGPNGLVTTPFTAAPFNTALWHTLDLRIKSATDTSEATLDLRLDDQVVNLGPANSSWAPGTNLPPSALVGAQVGFEAQLVSAAGNVNNLYTHQLRFMTAPTVALTL